MNQALKPSINGFLLLGQLNVEQGLEKWFASQRNP
jgi:hypothetical protein